MKNEVKEIKLVFAGSGPFADPIFTRLSKDFNNLTLITKEDKPQGRGIRSEKSALKTLTESRNIPVFEPKNKAELEKIINEINPDLAIVASLGIIITENTLKMPRYGFLNVHFSLLPLHRGPSPVQSTILSGDKEAGITFQKMAPRIDEGDILYQEKVEIRADDTAETLGAKMAKLSSQKLPRVIIQYIEQKTETKKQKGAPSYTKIIKKEDGRIDWSESAEITERKVRAYTPWPSAYTFWNGKMLKILEADVLKEESEKEAGTFIDLSGEKYGIQTGKGILIVEKLQLGGRRAMATAEFVRGYRDIAGSILGTEELKN